MASSWRGLLTAASQRGGSGRALHAPPRASTSDACRERTGDAGRERKGNGAILDIVGTISADDAQYAPSTEAGDRLSPAHWPGTRIESVLRQNVPTDSLLRIRRFANVRRQSFRSGPLHLHSSPFAPGDIDDDAGVAPLSAEGGGEGAAAAFEVLRIFDSLRAPDAAEEAAAVAAERRRHRQMPNRPPPAEAAGEKAPVAAEGQQGPPESIEHILDSHLDHDPAKPSRKKVLQGHFASLVQHSRTCDFTQHREGLQLQSPPTSYSYIAKVSFARCEADGSPKSISSVLQRAFPQKAPSSRCVEEENPFAPLSALDSSNVPPAASVIESPLPVVGGGAVSAHRLTIEEAPLEERPIGMVVMSGRDLRLLDEALLYRLASTFAISSSQRGKVLHVGGPQKRPAVERAICTAGRSFAAKALAGQGRVYTVDATPDDAGALEAISVAFAGRPKASSAEEDVGPASAADAERDLLEFERVVTETIERRALVNRRVGEIIALAVGDAGAGQLTQGGGRQWEAGPPHPEAASGRSDDNVWEVICASLPGKRHTPSTARRAWMALQRRRLNLGIKE